MYFLWILIFNIVVTMITAKNIYCTLCSQHTMCTNNLYSPGKLCKGYEYHLLMPDDNFLILHELNKVRHVIAGGGSKFYFSIQRQPKAANMRELMWDEELAAIARQWAFQCITSVDTCRDIPRFKVSQLVSAGGNIGPFVSDLPQLIRKFYYRSVTFNESVIGRYTAEYDKTEYNEFFALAWANTEYVGCGRSVFKKLSTENYYWTMELLVCNFGPRGQIFGEPVYIVGEPASKCPMGYNRSINYSNLCANLSKIVRISPDKWEDPDYNMQEFSNSTTEDEFYNWYIKYMNCGDIVTRQFYLPVYLVYIFVRSLI